MRILIAVSPALDQRPLRDLRWSRRRSLAAIEERAGRLAARLYPALSLQHRISWTSRDQRLLVVGLSDEPAERWAVTGDDRAVLWAGYGPSLPSLARPLEAGGHLLRVVADASAVTVDAGQAAAQPVFHRSGPLGAVVSNRAPFAHLLAQPGDLPEVDPLGASALLTSGFAVAREHPLAGVRMLEPEERLELRPDAALEVGRVPRERGRLTVEQGSQVLAERITAMAAGIPAGDVRCGVTGGRDSRLVVAGLYAAGRDDVLTYTGGFPSSIDVQLGARIAELLGYRHVVNEPQTRIRGHGEVIEVDIVARVRKTLHATDGLMNAFETVPGIGRLQGFTVLGGAGGELHRGGHEKGQPEPTLRDAKRYVRTRYSYKRRLLNEDAARHLQPRVMRWRRLAQRDPARAFDELYARWRVGRWVAATHLAKTSTRQVVLPFLDDLAVTSSRRVGFADRALERLHHGALTRMAPQLVDLPFDVGAWAFTRDRQETPRRPSTPPFQWRTELDHDARQVFREVILDGGRSAPLWDVLDREATLEHLAQDPAEYRLWWRLLTLRLTLDGHPWRDEPPGEAIIRIPVPPGVRA